MPRRNTLIMQEPDLSRFLPLLNSGVRGEELQEFRGHGRTGRPSGTRGSWSDWKDLSAGF
jgi:hypothetical protein